MTLFIDEIHKFYSNPQNMKAFEEWKARKRKHDDAATQSKTQKTYENQTARA
jgi:hypothetical protein|nr:MAG TPA: AAA-like domain protein [Caudoviricetes sp.]